MATVTETTLYDPARRPNPAAAERAVFYARGWGSAAVALTKVEDPTHNDAFDRAVCEELRQLRYVESRAALQADEYAFFAGEDHPALAGIAA